MKVSIYKFYHFLVTFFTKQPNELNSHKKYKWKVWIDTGGTFTDCLAYDPNGNFYRTKVLSSSALRGKIIKVIDGNSLLINANWQVEKDIFRNYAFQLLNQFHPPLKVRSFDVVHNIVKLSKAVDAKVFKQADFAIISPEPAPVLTLKTAISWKKMRY